MSLEYYSANNFKDYLKLENHYPVRVHVGKILWLILEKDILIMKPGDRFKHHSCMTPTAIQLQFFYVELQLSDLGDLSLFVTFLLPVLAEPFVPLSDCLYP